MSHHPNKQNRTRPIAFGYIHYWISVPFIESVVISEFFVLPQAAKHETAAALPDRRHHQLDDPAAARVRP
jgi:hypothetical protein